MSKFTISFSDDYDFFSIGIIFEKGFWLGWVTGSQFFADNNSIYFTGLTVFLGKRIFRIGWQTIR